MMETPTDLSENKEKQASLRFTVYTPSSGTNVHSEYGFQETSNPPPCVELKPPSPGSSIFHV